MRARLRFDGGPNAPRTVTFFDGTPARGRNTTPQVALSIKEVEEDNRALDLSRLCAGISMLMLGRVARPSKGDALDLSERHVMAALDDLTYVALPASEIGALVASLGGTANIARHLPVKVEAQEAAVTRSLLLPSVAEQVSKVYKDPLQGVDLRFSKRSPLVVQLSAIAPYVPTAIAAFVVAYMKLSKHQRDLRKMDREDEFEQLKLRALKAKVQSIEEAAMIDNLERQLKLTSAILEERNEQIEPIREAFLADGAPIDASIHVEFLEHPKVKTR